MQCDSLENHLPVVGCQIISQGKAKPTKTGGWYSGVSGNAKCHRKKFKVPQDRSRTSSITYAKGRYSPRHQQLWINHVRGIPLTLFCQKVCSFSYRGIDCLGVEPAQISIVYALQNHDVFLEKVFCFFWPLVLCQTKQIFAVLDTNRLRSLGQSDSGVFDGRQWQRQFLRPSLLGAFDGRALARWHFSVGKSGVIRTWYDIDFWPKNFRYLDKNPNYIHRTSDPKKTQDIECLGVFGQYRPSSEPYRYDSAAKTQWLRLPRLG